MSDIVMTAASPVTRSWVHARPAWMQRAGHAVLADGGVWVVDPPDGDGVLDAIRDLGEPRGVVQLLDRHPRDCAAVAEALRVPLHVVPLGAVADAPFEVLPLWHVPGWKEDALWFPQERVLVVAEALVGAPLFAAPGEDVGVHPMRRLLPPSALAPYAERAEHLLLGHGPARHGDEARAAVRDAFAGSRRRVAPLLVAQVSRVLRRQIR